MSLKKRAFTATLWSAVETFSIRGLRFVFGVLLARLLSPEEVGLVAMVYIFVEIANILSNSGFQTALIQKSSVSREEQSSVFYLNAFLGFVMAAALYQAAEPIAYFFEQPKLVGILQLMSFVPILNALSVIQFAALTRALNMKYLAMANFAAVMVSGVVCVSMALNGYGVWSIVGQVIAQASTYLVTLWILSPFRPMARFSWSSIRSLWPFSSSILLWELINKVFDNLFYVVIAKFYSAEALGVYSRADSLQKYPAQSVTTIFSKVAFPTLSRVQNDKNKMGDAFRRIFCVTALFIIPFMSTLSVMAEDIIIPLLTEKWAAAIPVFTVLCFYGAFYPLLKLNMDLLLANGRSKAVVTIEVINKCILVVVVALCYSEGILALAYGQIVISALSYMVCTAHARKLADYALWFQVRDLFPFVSGSAVCWLVCYGIKEMFMLGHVLNLLFLPVVSVVVYVAWLSILGNPTFMYLSGLGLQYAKRTMAQQ